MASSDETGRTEDWFDAAQMSTGYEQDWLTVKLDDPKKESFRRQVFWAVHKHCHLRENQLWANGSLSMQIIIVDESGFTIKNKNIT